MENLIYIPIGLAVIGLIFMFVKMIWVKSQSAGDEKMQGIAKNIKEGAMAFLSAELITGGPGTSWNHSGLLKQP